MNNNLRRSLLPLPIFLLFFLMPVSLYSYSILDSPHGDGSKLLKGCWSCHKGHGIYNTPMLPNTADVFCFRCHGDSFNIEQTKNSGDLAEYIVLEDIQKEFEKPYHHPIEQIGIHKYGEILPETDASAPRHSVCRDCHHQHYVTKENTMKAIKGVNKDGTIVESIEFEYELCFKCHSYSANLPPDQTNKAEIFNISNPSYHPVIAPGKNSDVPSLVFPLTTSSVIKCSDCHNNDNPIGPRGPHGSSYEHILTKNFTTTDGSESSFKYELCYSCHSRTSILGDESFPLHNLHISVSGTSCRTCHNSHGSERYAHLIDLDNLSITPSSGGSIDFIDLGVRAGECYLTCHGRDHNPAIYPVIP